MKIIAERREIMCVDLLKIVQDKINSKNIQFVEWRQNRNGSESPVFRSDDDRITSKMRELGLTTETNPKEDQGG